MSGVDQASENGDPVAENGKPVESALAYPRPPRLEFVDWRIRVLHRDVTVVDAPGAFRVLETSQPPAYYVDPKHVNQDHLKPSALTTFCEWKGSASYVDVVVGDETVTDAGWFYTRRTGTYSPIANHYAFYAQKLRCLIDDEEVDSNDGSFYGGWITSNITGPFKGAPGTLHW